MNPDSLKKYKPFPKINLPDRKWPSNTITSPPIWCSVDLRDGNQALPTPMDIDKKLLLFETLVNIGFKEIEVGFPSASETEFKFLRTLIENNKIPDDVTIQVLVPGRSNLIHKTIESLQGVKNAIIHLYNSTSPLQRRITFSNASKNNIIKIATNGTTLIKKLCKLLEGSNIKLQYSPESFSDTELDFSLEICNAVSDIWEPSENNKIILNLPSTVEWTTPNIYADQIEYICNNIKNRSLSIISLHTHNDRGTGVASTELGLLAGADRVEGTLFGNGERTGNLDITTVSINMNSHGINTGLNFSNIPSIGEIYRETTLMDIDKRHPYSGDLVFTAFSGSHQDAIKKGMDLRKKLISDAQNVPWEVPYLTIDPEDIGCNYKSIIRINSQSGKGGVAYILDSEHGFNIPKDMHPQIGKYIYEKADEIKRELTSDEILSYFTNDLSNINYPLNIIEHSFEVESDNNNSKFYFKMKLYDSLKEGKGNGNGPIAAINNFLSSVNWKNFSFIDYHSHSIGKGSMAKAASYVKIQNMNSKEFFWGCGIDSSIQTSALKSLICAFNIMEKSINDYS